MIRGHRYIDGLDPVHQDQHRVLFNAAQKVVEKVATVAPTVTTLEEGSIQFALISGTMYLYANKGNVIYYAALTAA